MEQYKSEQGFSVVYILIATILAVGLMGSAYYLGTQQRKAATQYNGTSQNQVSSTPSLSPSPSASATPKDTQPKATQQSSSAQSTDLNKIARNLFAGHLDGMKSASQPKNSRITDYSIDKIDGLKIPNSNHFCFSANYSIKPISLNTDYWNAYGEADKEGWIRNIYAFVDVSKVNGEYKINGIGTGGICN